MSQDNHTTTITEFIIIGFPGVPPKYYDLVGAALFVLYASTLAGNLLFITLFLLQHSLHVPMYIVMLSLALSDLGFSTATLPKAIAKYWFGSSVISFHACFFQRQLVHYFGTLNSVIMMLMALDRYVAICFSLRYQMLMTNRVMGLLNGLAWVTAMIAPTITIIYSLQLPFCGPNTISNIFCDSTAIVSNACAEPAFLNSVSLPVSMFVLLLPFSLILLSYASVIVAVSRIASKQGRLKTFSTCSTQLCIISIYYIPRIVVYLTPFVPNVRLAVDTRIGLQLFYSLFPPLVNPMIYCFRTKEIRDVFHKMHQRRNLFKQKISIAIIYDHT